ncbi:MAG: exodeoxyribonuclease VII large subunit [Flavobacteriales bacterium]|nr:MAG: exodeoxyribonuclease VII large subunit [Flavobacteriales bacterium]
MKFSTIDKFVAIFVAMEVESKKNVYRLSQITKSIHRALEVATGGKHYWVKAEISQWKTSQKGHAYLELVEMQGGQKMAAIQAVIWSMEMQVLQSKLKGDFGQIFNQGSEIVCMVGVEYHPVFGLKLRIIDVDISFTLGELEKRRRACIERLRSEGLLSLNRQLPVPRILQRIALITAPGSAAYTDFTKHLEANEFGYSIRVTTFSVRVQGVQSAAEIRQALLSINYDQFDAIAIIRGGGSTLDLDGFNDYELCKAAALCPLPILSGIGHETDLSVLDMVVGLPHKTPTAVADYIIDQMQSFEIDLLGMLNAILRQSKNRLSRDLLILENSLSVIKRSPASFVHRQRGDLHNISGKLARLTVEKLQRSRQVLKDLSGDIALNSKQKLAQRESQKIHELQELLIIYTQHRMQGISQQLENLQQTIKLLRPEKLLARGFSISRIQGKAIRDVRDLQSGDEIETELFNGNFRSVITQIHKKNNNDE